MRRPVPLAFWLLTLATASQGAAAVWALTHDQARGVVMAVSAVVFLAITIAVYVKRPIVDDVTG